jgi:hypothetical protein
VSWAQGKQAVRFCKKNQKILLRLAAPWPGQRRGQTDRRFCFFFQKEALASLPLQNLRSCHPKIPPVSGRAVPELTAKFRKLRGASRQMGGWQRRRHCLEPACGEVARKGCNAAVLA